MLFAHKQGAAPRVPPFLCDLQIRWHATSDIPRYPSPLAPQETTRFNVETVKNRLGRPPNCRQHLSCKEAWATKKQSSLVKRMCVTDVPILSITSLFKQLLTCSPKRADPLVSQGQTHRGSQHTCVINKTYVSSSD